MSHYCSECEVHWWPYQTTDGRCPQCGGGSRRSHAPPSGDAVERHRAAVAAADRRELHRRFEAYYENRPRRSDAA